MRKQHTTANAFAIGGAPRGNIYTSVLWQGVSQSDGQDADSGLLPALAKSFFMVSP